VVASYLELYEEGEVEHINGPTLPPFGAFKLHKGRMGLIVGFFNTAQELELQKLAVQEENWPNTIDMFDFTLSI